MNLGVISVRYARALLKASVSEQKETETYHDMMNLAKSFMDVPELRYALDNPLLHSDKKQRILEVACGESISALTKRFLALCLSKGRETMLQFIATSYITIYREYKHIIRGKLVTATAVSDTILTKMQQLVQNMTTGSVEFKAEVDPNLIGGFVLEYDSYRIDASVVKSLRKILAELN